MPNVTAKLADQSDRSEVLHDNLHCCVVELAGLGILIKGRSGSGKTSLALGLVDAFCRDSQAAMLVADDQAYLKMSGTRLIATCPDTISGKAELRGFGIADYPSKRQTAIGLVVELQKQKLIERIPQPQTTNIHGIVLPLLKVPQQHEAQGIRIVSAWISRWSNECCTQLSQQ